MEVKLCIAKEARRKSNIEALEIKYGGIGMTLKEILEAGGGILFVVLTLVQVAPIKVNPWTVLGRSIGRVLNKEVMDKIEEGNAKNARYRIIRFNDEVKHDVKHTEEHFDQIIEDIDTYENYCSDHPHFPNGKAVHSISNIRKIYDNCSDEHSFL